MKKHFIYTGSRSGSNYLVSLLNSHPQITNYGEALGDWVSLYKLHSQFGLGGKSTLDYLNYIYTSPLFFSLAQVYSAIAHLRSGKPINFKGRKQVQTIGIKDFHMNLSGDKSPLWSFFENDNEMLIIHLYRENLLKKFVSLEVMTSTKIISSQDLNKKGSLKNQPQKLYVSPSNVLQRLEKSYAMLQERMNRLEQLPQERVIHIRYEDLFSSALSHDFYRDEIFRFLGVQPINTAINQRKILSKNLSDIIENYNELYEMLIKTQFAHYLNVQD